MSFIAGTYHGTWGALPLGITEQGYELEWNSFAELIRGDNFGDGIQDGVYRAADIFASAVFEEWTVGPLGDVTNTNIPQIIAPWNTPNNFGQSGVVGRLWSAMAQALLLTSATGVPARVNNLLFGDSVTITKAFLQESSPVRTTLSTRHRKVAVRLRALPQSPSAVNPYGTWLVPDNSVA